MFTAKIERIGIMGRNKTKPCAAITLTVAYAVSVVMFFLLPYAAKAIMDVAFRRDPVIAAHSPSYVTILISLALAVALVSVLIGKRKGLSLMILSAAGVLREAILLCASMYSFVIALPSLMEYGAGASMRSLTVILSTLLGGFEHLCAILPWAGIFIIAFFGMRTSGGCFFGKGVRRIFLVMSIVYLIYSVGMLISDVAGFVGYVSPVFRMWEDIAYRALWYLSLPGVFSSVSSILLGVALLLAGLGVMDLYKNDAIRACGDNGEAPFLYDRQ